VRSDLRLCEVCGYPRPIGQPCTACPPPQRPHVLTDTPANRAALASISVRLYNALGEMQRQHIGARTVEQRAAQREAERLLNAARANVEGRVLESSFLLACDLAPGSVALALRTVGPREVAEEKK
jgi:hypothetical protein